MPVPKQNEKSRIKRVVFTMAAFIFLALIMESLILSISNRKNGNRTTELLSNHVVNLIAKDAADKAELTASLKEEYITRARTVAYILDLCDEGFITKENLERMAGFVGVDEIHIFDDEGTIYMGTQPRYYGYSFYSGIQMAYFLPMLSDKSKAMCQDLTPNTAENKMMMYAITWCLHGDRMIQVGIEPVRLLKVLDSVSFAKMISNMPAYDGVTIAVSDRSGRILASNASVNIGSSLQEVGFTKSAEPISEDYEGALTMNGYRHFVRLRCLDDYIVAVAYSTEPHLSGFLISLVSFLVFLIIVGIVIVFMVRRQEKLIFEFNTDELSGLFNRRAYEEDIALHKNLVTEKDYIYVSMDLNGLKVVNDTLGHEAGDEIIRGASDCMKQCFGPYGRLYRIGGDEFAAMILATRIELDKIKKDFESCITEWKGKLVDHVYVSCGYAPVYDCKTNVVTELAAIADKRMYAAKSAFYRKKGVDRRGQQDAHTALCALYTKILKINITDDSYQIVNMLEAEQDVSKGFADKISVWLRNFGTSGQVHPEDLANYLAKTKLQYLRDYFSQNKTSISIYYRRKFENDYKQAVMEMIPANDYSPENQSLYLYVKSIDE